MRELQKRDPGMQRRSRSLERRKRMAESAPDPDSPVSLGSTRSRKEDPFSRPLEEFVEGQHAYVYWYNLAIECEDDGEVEEALEVSSQTAARCRGGLLLPAALATHPH